MFDEENESSIEQMQAASIVPFLVLMILAIIGSLITLYILGEK